MGAIHSSSQAHGRDGRAKAGRQTEQMSGTDSAVGTAEAAQRSVGAAGKKLFDEVALAAAWQQRDTADPARRGQAVYMPPNALFGAQMAGDARPDAARAVRAAAIRIVASRQVAPSKTMQIHAQRRIQAEQNHIGARLASQFSNNPLHRSLLHALAGPAGRGPCRRNSKRSSRRRAASKFPRIPRTRERTGRNRWAWFGSRGGRRTGR